MIFGNGRASFEDDTQAARMDFQETLALRLAGDKPR